MSFLKNMVKNAVGEGISKGIKDAVGSAVEKAVNPAAERWANSAAKQMDEATGQMNSAAQAVNTANAEAGNAFANLQRAAQNYASTLEKTVGAVFSFPEYDGSNKAYEGEFINLVNANGGFEAVLGFQGFVDHALGGTGSTIWYCISSDSRTECCMATFSGGVWTDEIITKENGGVSKAPCESGKTLALIAQRLYTGRNDIAGKTPVAVENAGFRCSRYNFSFGAKAYDISDDYGITVRFSDTDNAIAGYSLRNINAGANVKPPEF